MSKPKKQTSSSKKKTKQKSGTVTTVVSLVIVLAVFGALLLVFHSLNHKKPDENISYPESVQIGTYPQSMVSDEALLGELSRLPLEWRYYDDCYAGGGYYGTMQKTNCMKYADVTYQEKRYRAVMLEQYRPSTTLSPPIAEESRQDDNGFSLNKVYWFLFEPINWLICDTETGFLLMEKILDAMPFNTNVYWIDRNFDKMPNFLYELSANEWVIFPANLYKTSSVRKWLNHSFFPEAFSEEDRKMIKGTWHGTAEPGNRTRYALLSWNRDCVFLPSLKSIATKNKNTNNFSPIWESKVGTAQPTDYALCRGLYAEAGKTQTNAWQWLCTPGDGTADVFSISDGNLLTNVDRQYYYADSLGGIRCAARLRSLKKLVKGDLS